MATEEYIRYGIGVSHSGEGATKVVGIGTSDKLLPGERFSFLAYQFEGGYWFDTQASKGRKSSGYGSAEVGMKVHAGPFAMSSFHGPGFITATDSFLGSIPQFFHDVNLGLEDDRNGATISVGYKHISNAGLFSKINRGRDFMTIKLSVPW